MEQPKIGEKEFLQETIDIPSLNIDVQKIRVRVPNSREIDGMPMYAYDSLETMLNILRGVEWYIKTNKQRIPKHLYTQEKALQRSHRGHLKALTENIGVLYNEGKVTKDDFWDVLRVYSHLYDSQQPGNEFKDLRVYEWQFSIDQAFEEVRAAAFGLESSFFVKASDKMQSGHDNQDDAEIYAWGGVVSDGISSNAESNKVSELLVTHSRLSFGSTHWQNLITDEFGQASTDNFLGFKKAATNRLRVDIKHLEKPKERENFGATFSLYQIDHTMNTVYVAWSGDSPVYALTKSGELVKLTEPHDLVHDYGRSLTKEQRNLLRALRGTAKNEMDFITKAEKIKKDAVPRAQLSEIYQRPSMITRAIMPGSNIAEEVEFVSHDLTDVVAVIGMSDGIEKVMDDARLQKEIVTLVAQKKSALQITAELEKLFINPPDDISVAITLLKNNHLEMKSFPQRIMNFFGLRS